MERKMETNNDKSFSLIDSMITAMFLPKEYGKLLKLSNKRIVRYVAVVMFLVCVIQYAILGLGSIAGLGGIQGIVMNEIPEFSLQDGTFYLGEKIEKEFGIPIVNKRISVTPIALVGGAACKTVEDFASIANILIKCYNIRAKARGLCSLQIKIVK